MPPLADTAFIVFDTESVVDGALLARVLYPGEALAPEEAIRRFEAEIGEDRGPMNRPERPFIPVAFHVPVAIAVARIGADLRLRDLSLLDAPRFDPQAMVKLFWRGIQTYTDAVFVDFNGRGFDLPLLTLSAFRFGISAPRYFDDPDRYGFRSRYGAKHLDLLDWITEHGAFRLRGGLNLLAKMLGKPGKMDVRGDRVQDLHAEGKLQEINDYCLHDVLDTYFVFLRTRVLMGRVTIEEEGRIVADAKEWLGARARGSPAIAKYLESFGAWSPEPFR
jgi:predicted PolB exonuclease-like 3'-5' exonuclease